LLIHDFTPHVDSKIISLERLLKWTDIWELMIPNAAGKVRAAKWHTVVITTNKEPHRWWTSLPWAARQRLFARMDYIVCSQQDD